MISLCITTYNRYDLLLESFNKVLGDPRITEIIIVDDNSKPEICNLLSETLSGPIYADRVTLHINQENIGMSRNKARAVELATNPWCILFDSDNVIDSSYLDALPEYLAPSVIYCPDFAKPQFDYRKYAGKMIDRDNAKHIVIEPMGECLMNTANYLVHRDSYLEVYKYDSAIDAADTIHFNYLWMLAGNRFQVVSGMYYQHRVHPGSGFLKNVDKNMKDAKSIKSKILDL